MTGRDALHTDVLVIGAGPSGLAAAQTAAAGGASVTIVEATGEIGGNAAFSTGYLAFADTSEQRRLGIVDSPEAYLADLRAEVEHRRELFDPAFDTAVAERFTRESGAGFEYLRDLGFRFDRIVSRPLQHSVDRTVVLSDPTQFRSVFAEHLERLGAGVLVRRRARELVRTGGTVTGALIEGPGGTTTEIRAGRGVIVTTGGYQASSELRARHRPDADPDSPYPGLDTNLGDGHRMLEEAGAELVNMHMVPEVVLIASRLIEECVALTEDGVRFHDETGPEALRLLALRRLPGSIGYYLCDARTAEGKAQLLADVPAAKKTFDSLAGVARAIDADPAVLAETVRRWNKTVESGVPADPEFGRVVFPQPRTGITTPPYTVVPMVVGTNISAGGSRVSPDMEVLDSDARPITGLYAAGDCSAGISAAIGIGGLHLAAGITLGRVAGRSVSA
ncbi:FAD-dependent oxidoreductase [Amycolatopsis rhabdoformis]|uniref:FAD-dependent oxidoreductase n=1 Tax=Amycolatopsis rhabdoformis TaxID=1448059 RepID=A0ABZ1IE74_9PSEU|nr:FAD-dependent oxidoreductase [Amycolatopsis rhabdoformis]WSE32222.1 FAD-dependent oxidoreductase [Amycolatopsis rhabdoformis]